MKIPDLEVIKDIPGYKVILKAVLKSQIQELVKQIAKETDEETVVVSANLSDGSVSYYGSESGKSFLDNHDEFKSQFLGFCLKRLHKKSIEHRQIHQDGSQESSGYDYATPLPDYHANSTEIGFRSKRFNRALRHEPYKRSKGNVPHFRTASHVSHNVQNNDSTNKITIKMEHESDPVSEIGANFGAIETQNSSSKISEPAGTLIRDEQTIQDSYLESSSSANECVPSADSYSEQSNSELNSFQIGSDGTINIKQEHSTDSEVDIKVTGMELPSSGYMHEESFSEGTAMLNNGREAGVAMGMTSDLTKQRGDRHVVSGETSKQHHTANWTEVSSKQYKQMEKDLTCVYCSKVLSNFANLKRHLRIHEGIYPYQCKQCNKKFSDASNFKKHGIIHCLDKSNG